MGETGQMAPASHLGLGPEKLSGGGVAAAGREGERGGEERCKAKTKKQGPACCSPDREMGTLSPASMTGSLGGGGGAVSAKPHQGASSWARCSELPLPVFSDLTKACLCPALAQCLSSGPSPPSSLRR